MGKQLSIAVFAVVAFTLGTAATPTNASAQDRFIGEIIWVGYSFCPRGFADANGQLLPISGNEALFSLYGTFYGGDGRTTFALPDLRGRMALHTGQGPGLPNYPVGSKGGADRHVLTPNEMPAHSHSATVNASADDGNSASPDGALLAFAECTNYDSDGPMSQVPMSSSMVSVGNAGGNQAHNNMPPYLTIRACVALVGIFPSRN